MLRSARFSVAKATTVVLTAGAAAILYWAQSTSPAPTNARVVAIAFSTDARLLAAGGANGRIRIWTTRDWTTLAKIGNPPQRLNALAFSPNNTTLAAAGDGLILWNLPTLNREIVPQTGGRIYGTVKYSPDGTKIATVSSRERMDIWDAQSRQRLREFCCTALYGDVAFDPKGETLASSGHILRFWNLETGTEVARLQDDEYVVSQIAFSPDGKLLASGSQDRRLRLWDVAAKRELRVFAGHEAYVESVAFSPDAALVASGGRGNPVRVWNTTTGEPINLPPQISTGDVRFSPDGQWLAAATSDSVWLWNLTANAHRSLKLE